MFDIVIPDGNEREIIAMAHRLGYAELVLVYKEPRELPHTGLLVSLSCAVVATPRRPFKGVLTVAESGEHDRQLLEHFPPTIMYDFELAAFPDTFHQRVSGLSPVLCKLAAGRTTVFFSLRTLLGSSGFRRSRVLGRMMQNVLLCRKYGVQMGMASFASDPLGMRGPRDVQSLAVQIGMTPEEAKKAVQSVPKILSL